MTNDRFRFRVWDTEKKELIYDAENAYDYMRPCSDGKIIEADCFGDVLESKRYIVEQCTGLKDKNGELIYEGDIIAVANGSINGNVCISKWEVVWKEKEGRYSVPLWVADKPDFSHYVKVLGNIHENPELLEEHK